jgi:hypothetical protein
MLVTPIAIPKTSVNAPSPAAGPRSDEVSTSETAPIPATNGTRIPPSVIAATVRRSRRRKSVRISAPEQYMRSRSPS